MKLSALSLLLVCVGVSFAGGHSLSAQSKRSASSKPVDKWQTVSDTTSHFRIEMPGTPAKSMTGGTGHDPDWMFQENNPRTVYVVSVGPYKGSGLSAANTLLEQEIANTIKEFPGKAVVTKRLTMSGYPGAEIRITLKDGAMSRARVYLVNGYEYNMSVTTQKKYIDASRAERFFKSFSITK